MRRVIRALINNLIPVCLVFTAVPAVAGTNFHGELTLATGNVFRGIEQVQDGMAYSAYLEKGWSNGLYAGIWGGRSRRSDHAIGDWELNYVAGYNRTLSHKLRIDSALVHYQYPQSWGYRNYDWTEWLTSVYLNDRWILSYGLGEDWFAEDELSHFGEVTRIVALPQLVVLELSLGAVRLENAYVDGYQYLEMGLSRSFGPFYLRGLLSLTDADSRHLFGDRAAGRQASIALRWSF